MWVRLLDSSGSTISSATYGYYNLFIANADSDSSETAGYANNTTAWQVTASNGAFAIGNESDEGFSGLVRLYNTRDTSFPVIGGIEDVAYQSVDGYAVRTYGSAWRNSTTAAISGLLIQVFGPTITSGSFAVYGYKLGV